MNSRLFSLIGLTSLLVFFCSIYLLNLYLIPYQINSDEITILKITQTASHQPINQIFGLASYYFYTPTFIFMIFGYLANFFGGITFYNMRLIHAFFGLIIIFLSYFFFRISLNNRWAIIASSILGINHSLIAISRMAMRDNSGLLFEILSLFFLLKSINQRSHLLAILGGVFLGLCFYVYFVARITIVIWLIFILITFFSSKTISGIKLLKLTAITLVTVLIVCLPLIIETISVPPNSLHYQKEQILIFTEGQQMQKYWINAPSVIQGIEQNIINGLTIFTNNKSDYAYIYPNPNHGFTDPLTGWLVLIGFLLLLFKHQKNQLDILVLTGFLVLVFTFSFLINKAPDYTRLLIILPFVGYLAIQPLILIKSFIKNRVIKLTFLTIILLTIIFLNLLIFNDFVSKGLIEGNDLGSTARYVDDRKALKNYSFYLAANSQFPYYSWGDPETWHTWFGIFANPNQKTEVINPNQLMNSELTLPFTLFLSNHLWEQKNKDLIRLYPNYKLYTIKPDGSLLAFEVK